MAFYSIPIVVILLLHWNAEYIVRKSFGCSKSVPRIVRSAFAKYKKGDFAVQNGTAYCWRFPSNSFRNCHLLLVQWGGLLHIGAWNMCNQQIHIDTCVTSASIPSNRASIRKSYFFQGAEIAHFGLIENVIFQSLAVIRPFILIRTLLLLLFLFYIICLLSSTFPPVSPPEHKLRPGCARSTCGAHTYNSIWTVYWWSHRHSATTT